MAGRQAIPKRAAPDTTMKAMPMAPSDHPTPDVFHQIINDITGGAQTLMQQGQVAAGRIREGYEKIKKFVEPR